MTDPRLGKTSASKFHITVNCAGQEQLLRSMPPEQLQAIIAEPDEDAEIGSAIHLALQTGDTSALGEDQIAVYNDAVRWTNEIVANWCRDNAIEHYQEGPRENRLYIHTPSLEPVTSGQLDRIYFALPHILVIDYKTLYCTYLTPAEKNWQGRVQSVAAWQEYGAEHIRFALCKPRLRASPVDAVDYGLEDLQQGERSIVYHIWETKQPSARRSPGTWCVHCPGRSFCPEVGAYSLLPSVIAHNALSNGDPVAAVQQLVPADLVKIWSASTVIGKIFDAVKARLKAMTPEQLAELGLKRGKGRTTRTVNNARAVINALKAMNLSEEKIDEILKLSVPDIAMLLRREVGMSAQGAPQWVRENLASWLDESVSDAPIERITE